MLTNTCDCNIGNQFEISQFESNHAGVRCSCSLSLSCSDWIRTSKVLQVWGVRLETKKTHKKYVFKGNGTRMYDLPRPRPVPINATVYISNILEVSESKQMVSTLMRTTLTGTVHDVIKIIVALITLRFILVSKPFSRWTWRPPSPSPGLTCATSLTKTSSLGATSM